MCIGADKTAKEEALKKTEKLVIEMIEPGGITDNGDDMAGVWDIDDDFQDCISRLVQDSFRFGDKCSPMDLLRHARICGIL